MLSFTPSFATALTTVEVINLSEKMNLISYTAYIQKSMYVDLVHLCISSARNFFLEYIFSRNT